MIVDDFAYIILWGGKGNSYKEFSFPANAAKVLFKITNKGVERDPIGFPICFLVRQGSCHILSEEFSLVQLQWPASSPPWKSVKSTVE